jgi:hypothetical protein
VNKEYRLADGTFARTRPQHNTLWLDDMFMGIPPVAWYSCIAGQMAACLFSYSFSKPGFKNILKASRFMVFSSFL